ncbi:hypothetical protein DIPPA_33182 [Diplonema papillatum]|nr:hypothetical protein DIPPA_33182 [Diplonema papillatum]
MAFLSVNPDAFAACSPVVGEMPPDALRKLALHCLKACQRKRFPPSAEEYVKRLAQVGVEMSARKVETVTNWLDHLYSEAVRSAPEPEAFERKLGKTCRNLSPEASQVLAAVWAKEAANAHEPPVQTTLTLLSAEWRVGFPIKGNTTNPPSVSFVFNTQSPEGGPEPHPVNLPYSSFLHFSKAIKQANEALAAVSEQS